MRVQVRSIVEALYASWAVKDLSAVLDCFTDDIVYTMHAPADILPFAGGTCGKELFAQRLQMILDGFEFLSYRPVHISGEDDTFHAQVSYDYRHKDTGHRIEGSLRHVGHLQGDKIARLDEYHDAARLRAFFELLELSASGARQREFPNIRRNR